MEIKRNPHVIIGTPGRIKDMIQHKILDLSCFNNLILDEFDRILDMGLINDIKTIVNLIPRGTSISVLLGDIR